jgi:hypothetical protein
LHAKVSIEFAFEAVSFFSTTIEEVLMNTLTRSLHALYVLMFLLLSAPASAGPTYGVYEDAFGSGWSSAPWGASVSSSSTLPFRGTKSAKVVFTSAMGVFKPVASNGFKTIGYRHLTFAVYNYNNADDLWLVAQRSDGTLGTYLKVATYADKGSIPEAKWAWVRIPISHLGLGSSPQLSFFSVASGKANATAYFDEVGFGASTILYEGVDTSYGPGIRRYVWDALISTPYRSDGNYYFKVTTTDDYGGVRFQLRAGALMTGEHGALTIRFRTGILKSSCPYMVTLTDTRGYPLGATVCLDDYTTGGALLVGSTWHLLTVPMSAFQISSASVGGVMIEAMVPSTFYIDDVRLVQKLAWPMPGYGKSVSGFFFGKHWQDDYCSNYQKLHTGNDYNDWTQLGGRQVYAAARGIVRQINKQGDWGYAVVIQHESGLITSYLHLNVPSVSKDTEVQRGALIGTTASLSGNSHLHFGVSVSNYDSVVSQAGALPEKACEMGGISYPGFPARFIDSEILWQ